MNDFLGIYGNYNGIKGWNTSRTGSKSANADFKTVMLDSLKSTESMDSIFAEAARTYGVPLNLLKAVGKAESNFTADAVSSAGAIGVMQLMPQTASSLGVTDPYDARSNIMGGAKYLSQKLEQYDGNIELVLASYNAGSGNVEKYGGIPPFTETQNYIRRVMEYAGETQYAGRDVVSTATDTDPAVEHTMESALSTRELCLYMMEMMKLQIQSQFQSIINFEDTVNKNI